MSLVPALYAESGRELYEKGLRLMQEGSMEEAAAALKEAAELSPQIAQVHYAWGLASMQLQLSPYDALEAFEEAVRIDPQFSEAYYNLAIIHTGLVPDYDQAEEYYAKAIETARGPTGADFGMGWLKLLKRGDPEGAIPYLEASVLRNPEHVESKYFLGIAYIAVDQKPRALRPITELRMSGNQDMSRALETMLEENPDVVLSRILGTGPKEEGSDQL